MSIIHDALKKVQQGLTPKPDETPSTPAAKTPAPTSGYIYDTPKETTEQDLQPVEHLAPAQNKAKSILALICAAAITVGAFWFFFKQLNTYFPNLKRSAISSFYKLIHKKEEPAFKTVNPKDLVPLAKITVIPSTTKPLNPPNPTGPSVIAETPKPEAPLTLNIHGVMSNGSNNVVLINDQVYQEGDDVDGVKIVKINLNAITVDNNGQEEVIPVKQ